MQILVISSYPEKSTIHGEKTVGVGNYTKATLLSLIKHDPELKIRVFAEELAGPQNYVENKIAVERFWRRGSLLSQIYLFILAARQPETIIFLPFETFLFGGLISVAVFIPLLFYLKIKGKKIVLVLHQVLGGDINVFEKNRLKVALLTSVRVLFYQLLMAASQKVIVFEEEFKRRLGKSKKVQVIPHAVIQERVLNQDLAKEKLGLKKEKSYVFYFGFLSPYKGVEELLDIWEDLEDVDLIIGGGGNPNHLSKPAYKNFVDGVLAKAKEKGAVTTGFIPEEQMKEYFSAVDLVILPYTVFMSSSGPLSHAFSYGNGVLLSESLRGYFNSPDMKRALDESDISIEEICFSLDKPIRNKILWAVHNIGKLREFSHRMCRVRSWDVVGEEYLQVLKDLSK
jgi:glycosyltransferase involved in cell wall biosynthesis